jgi:hypothetical protein
MRFANNTVSEKARRNFVCVSHPQIRPCVGKTPRDAAKHMFLRLFKHKQFDSKNLPITLTLRETHTRTLHYYCCLIKPQSTATVKKVSLLRNLIVKKLKSKTPRKACRKFRCVFPPKLGVYSGQPAQAARKALSKIRQKQGLEEGAFVTVVLREIKTRTFYKYRCVMKKLMAPRKISFNGVDICFHRQSIVRLMSRTQVKHEREHDLSKMLLNLSSDVLPSECANGLHSHKENARTRSTSLSEHEIRSASGTFASRMFGNLIMKYMPY